MHKIAIEIEHVKKNMMINHQILGTLFSNKHIYLCMDGTSFTHEGDIFRRVSSYNQKWWYV